MLIPVYVIFLTPDPKAVRFAKPVEVCAGCMRVSMDPVIVGPGDIPVLTSSDAMLKDPLMAVLSVMAHGHREEVPRAFVGMLDELPADDATSLFGYTVDMAVPEARRVLEETVSVYVPKHSPWAQNLYREGEAAGEASSVLSVLRHRGIEVPPERERQIRSCTDLDQLDLWLRRALDAAHIDDLFDDASQPRPC